MTSASALVIRIIGFGRLVFVFVVLFFSTIFGGETGYAHRGSRSFGFRFSFCGAFLLFQYWW
jgi:hypothetical protein